VNQRRGELRVEVREQVLDLAPADRVVDRDEHVRAAHVAVVLGHLVLEDQVVAERVQRQLTGEPVVLVQVVRAGG
jgi:hypothetical protein